VSKATERQDHQTQFSQANARCHFHAISAPFPRHFQAIFTLVHAIPAPLYRHFNAILLLVRERQYEYTDDETASEEGSVEESGSEEAAGGGAHRYRMATPSVLHGEAGSRRVEQGVNLYQDRKVHLVTQDYRQKQARHSL